MLMSLSFTLTFRIFELVKKFFVLLGLWVVCFWGSVLLVVVVFGFV